MANIIKCYIHAALPEKFCGSRRKLITRSMSSNTLYLFLIIPEGSIINLSLRSTPDDLIVVCAGS